MSVYEQGFSTIYIGLRDGYPARKDSRRYLGELLLTRTGWRLSLVHAKEATLILTCPAHLSAGSYEHKIYYETAYEGLPELSDPYDIAKALSLGPVVDSRPLPYVPFTSKQAPDPQATSYELSGGMHVSVSMTTLPVDPHTEYYARLEEWSLEWATELADKHMAHTKPDFEQAKQRMVSAYEMLFRLEHTMRTLVEKMLEQEHGEAWWDKVPANVRNQVEGRENVPSTAWFDDFSALRLKFADFDGLRDTVLGNWATFGPIFGNRESFRPNMDWVSAARNRIAHTNTLSDDDYQEFLSQASRILDMAESHVALE